VVTKTDAKAVKSAFDRLMTYAKIGDLHHRRLAARKIRENVLVNVNHIEITALQKLFTVLAKRNPERTSGFTTTVNLVNRRGDNAPRTLIRIIDGEVIEAEKTEKPTKKPAKKAAVKKVAKKKSKKEEA
jgi:large subunit ribosomal protein L17